MRKATERDREGRKKIFSFAGFSFAFSCGRGSDDRLPDFFGPGNDFFLPVIILGIELIGFEAVLGPEGTDDGLVVDMQRDPVAFRAVAFLCKNDSAENGGAVLFYAIFRKRTKLHPNRRRHAFFPGPDPSLSFTPFIMHQP
jgi:hypothetical protein